MLSQGVRLLPACPPPLWITPSHRQNPPPLDNHFWNTSFLKTHFEKIVCWRGGECSRFQKGPVRSREGSPLVTPSPISYCETPTWALTSFWPLEVAIWGAWRLDFNILGNNFGTSGAPWGAILAPRDHLGGPWEQQDGHEVVRSRIFIDFGVILEPVYRSFLNSGRSKLHFVSGLIPEGFFIDFCVEISSFGHRNSRFSHGKYCKNQLWTKLVFCKFRTRTLVFFGSLGN